MNCANHADITAVAYCRTCGKALCANCTRDVRGVIYCENCLAERLQGAGAPNVPGVIPQPVGSTAGPNPAVAGILSGFFPFGVGAVYTGQYAKGLAHLLIFVGLVWALSSGHGSGLEPVLGISLGFFVVYQIIDSVRSARALQLGQQPPDPFGLGRTFAAGEKVDTSKVPTAAVVLIGLGVLFLLQTSIGFDVGRFWPLLLIGLGVWLFARRSGMLGEPGSRYGRSCYRGNVSGPVVLVTLGVLFLIPSFDGPGFGRTWPVLLLAIGLSKLLERGTSSNTGFEPPSSTPGAGGGSPEQMSPPPPSEVKNG